MSDEAFMTGGVLKLSRNDSGPHHPPILTQRIGPKSGREFRLVQDAARVAPSPSSSAALLGAKRWAHFARGDFQQPSRL